jgi:hypothetical protein
MHLSLISTHETGEKAGKGRGPLLSSYGSGPPSFTKNSAKRESSGAVFASFPVPEAAGIAGHGCPSDARSPELDHRVCVHEAAHTIAARLLGFEVGGVTCDPVNGFGGMTWGPRFVAALARTDADSVSFRDKVHAYMPASGEVRDEGTAIVLQHALNHCIELCAGSVGEEMLLPGKPMLASDDLRQEVVYGSLFTTSAEACESFVALARTMARDLLRPYVETIRALADALRIKRSMSGQEIDIEIASALARQSLAVEHERRRQWARRVESAKQFAAMLA